MKLINRLQWAVIMCLLLSIPAATVGAAEESACINCHLNEAKLIKNLSKAVTKTSAMQSGSG